MNKTHFRAYTRALAEARSHRQAALEVELSVGMAVMYECAPPEVAQPESHEALAGEPA